MDWFKGLLQLYGSGSNFFEQARKIYYYQNQDGNNRVAGYFRYDPLKKFTHLTIPKAGHFVPTFNMEASKLMVRDIIQYGQLKCHMPNDSDCETAPLMCSYMN